MVAYAYTLSSRGGIEDTRLEAKAKAKDTKKIRSQGQGQPFQRQTLLRPTTRMLEAKAKDQGHKCKCSPKQKKRSSKFFFRRSPKKRSTKTFFRLSPVKKRLLKFIFRHPTKFQQFKKKYCPRAEDRAIFEDLRPRGQGQGLDLRGQGQGLQNVSSRTPPLLSRTTKS